jgi:hypothetical protein
MALVKCKECGKEISKKAGACPHCGAKARRTGCLTWCIAGFAALVIIGAISNSMRGPDPDVGKAASPPRSAEDLAADRAVSRAAVAAKSIRSGARNPDSFVLESALVMPSGAACLEYRAQNGFGGMNREQAVIPAGKDDLRVTGSSGFLSSWSAHCAGKTGRDVTVLVRQYMQMI